ncbi:MAG TPA: hypothetical protein VFA75_00335 [Nevskia sp.]|nr:hypothetical protein [Nevskia sp.]
MKREPADLCSKLLPCGLNPADKKAMAEATRTLFSASDGALLRQVLDQQDVRSLGGAPAPLPSISPELLPFV